MHLIKASGYYFIIRKLLFLFNPETAHNLTFLGLRIGQALRVTRLFGVPSTGNQPVEVMGLNFPNRLGLAAGLDKEGSAVNGLGDLGFGFLEIGTVTPHAQPGNPRPRIFRIPARAGLINRMGFNNKGVDNLIHNIRRRRFKGILGINIGKQFTTPVEDALDDYIIGLKKVFVHADYIAINISSPNTPNLRKLQESDALDNLLSGLKKEHADLCETYNCYKPIVLKVAPDMDAKQVKHISSLLLKHKIDGLIATNTTLSREGIEDLAIANESGGLSGAPLTRRATEIVRLFASNLQGKIPIIAAGGIMNATDAQDKIAAGASLVQIYSGFIFRGPALINEILNELKAH